MNPPPLANAELAVMELLWDEGCLTARQLRERLYPNAERSQHGTVQRLLQRLEDKGFIDRDREPSVSSFSALIGREAYACSQLEALADKVTGGSLVPLITHLIEEKRISHAELRQLRRLLGRQPLISVPLDAEPPTDLERLGRLATRLDGQLAPG